MFVRLAPLSKQHWVAIMEQKPLIQAAGAIALFAAAWLGASVYLGRNAERELAERVDKTSADCAVRLSNLQQQNGLLSANGSLELQVGDLCSPDQTGKYWVVADVQYNVSHLILPGSAMRFNWTLRQRPEPDRDGPGLQFSGSGHSAFSGTVFSDIASAEMAGGAADSESWRLEPLTGHIEADEKRVNLSLKAPRFTLRGNGNALDVQGMGLQLNLLDRALGLGTSSLTVDKIASTNASGERLGVSSATVQNGDRIDTTIQYALGSIDTMGYAARDLALELAIRGLDAESIKTLADIAKESKSFQNLTLEENQRYRKALKQAINRGFSTGITKLSGTVSNSAANSALNGQLTIELKPNANPDADIELAKVLQSSGQVSVSGDAIGEEQKNQWVEMGIATAGAEGLQAGYEYAAGILKTNDRVIDGQWLQQTLTDTDAHLNRFLNDPESEMPVPGLENVINPQTENDAGVSDSAPDLADQAANPLAYQSISMTGRAVYAESGAMLESSDGQRLYFAADSDVGQLIVGLCREGETCAVTALVDADRQIKAIQQLNAIPAAETEPSGGTTPAAN
ncbi:DUF945 family protein [Methylomonas sp. EFPC3]|uniref:DUF945 family protein n=1 Tax=Methylomonas sp. EFPC3 TaxID=3021710 RepID=UPI0024169FD6|nr:DUF945 family protein [Methylomonas sp. EFPC3]WFP51324.1 DUF945 family protein [Methylomonas sp. EFPC3]